MATQDKELEERLNKVRNEGGIEVMKASAGSGKTFSLAREYIRLLLSEKDTKVKAHRHILAVTFTNKATAEMKSRIVEELHKLSQDPAKSKYTPYLLEKCGFMNNEQLKAASDKALTDILNDYSAFSVSTIDKFFQQTLRAFSREIGQFAEYKVELDRKSLVTESVDRLLDSLSDENKNLLKWISESSIEKIEAGEGYHLESNLGEFAEGYLSANFQSKADELQIDEEQAFSADNIKKLDSICKQLIKTYEEEFLEASAKLADKIGDNSAKLVNAHLYNKAQALKQDGIKAIDSKFLKETPQYMTNPEENGFTAKGKKTLSQGDIDEIVSDVNAIMDMLGRPYTEYRTAKILTKQLYVFRLAKSLRKCFDDLLSEKNVLGIEDTDNYLKDIIGNTETPFIYEKTGTRYKHFLLDEFQDTSTVQWENFLPLLRNSISEGCYNLIVGDVKQSIYRWRDADWNILGKQVEQEFHNTVSHPLLENHRSAPKIVRFNNAFYKELSQHIESDGMYSDVEQTEVEGAKVPGCVDITFCNKVMICDYVVAAINDARSRGFAYKDMAVIVRTNAQGAEIANYLIANHIHVITNDSLRIANGASVRAVVSGLFKVDDPADAVNTFLAQDFDYSVLDGTRSLTEMADALFAQLPAEQVNADTLYVLAFMDLLRDFVSRSGNSLHAFLEYWKQDGMKANISSPEGSDAVTIITVHKCKGLSFPMSVIPMWATAFMKSDNKSWEMPDVKGSAFESCESALYHVNLTSTSQNTLFSGCYDREKQMCDIDNSNTWYVAMTRPEEEMYIIAEAPGGDAVKATSQTGWAEVKNMPAALYMYLNLDNPEDNDHRKFVAAEPMQLIDDEEAEDAEEVESDAERYIYGEHAGKVPPKPDDENEPKVGKVDLNYEHEGVSTDARGKIRVSNDAAEFFLGNGDQSKRKRGIVLHGILESVIGPGDLHSAVVEAVASGSLSADDADDTESMLSGAIASVKERGWFPGVREQVMDERDIIRPLTTDGRPDRVVFKDGGRVEIIDYKFGEEHPKYTNQVRDYISDFRQMGYTDVHGYLWYVESGNIKEI